MSFPIDVRVTGTALETNGFLSYQFALSPLAVITKGFISDCADIWSSSDVPITTVWTCSITPNPPDIEVCVGD